MLSLVPTRGLGTRKIVQARGIMSHDTPKLERATVRFVSFFFFFFNRCYMYQKEASHVTMGNTEFRQTYFTAINTRTSRGTYSTSAFLLNAKSCALYDFK